MKYIIHNGTRIKIRLGFNLPNKNKCLTVKLMIIIPQIITICSLEEDPDQTKKWGNKLHAQKILGLIYIFLTFNIYFGHKL